MASRTSPTSYALLGLLALRPWTTPEIIEQVERSMRHFWPRSRAHVHAELGRMVERGHAVTESVPGARRPRTLYTITDAGRSALDGWFGSPTSAPVLELEALLRLLLGDLTSRDRLEQALEETLSAARTERAHGAEIIRGLAEDGGPFPDRLHLVMPLARFLERWTRLQIGWLEETLAEVRTWDGTVGHGLTEAHREELRSMLAEHDGLSAARPSPAPAR